VTCVAFSSDDKRVASGANERNWSQPDETVLVRLWEPSTGQEIRTFRGNKGQVTSVAFSPDGKRLASANGETVTLWDSSTGQAVVDLGGHSGLVQSVAYSPDGKRLASAGGKSFVGQPGEVKVWDASTGENLFTSRGHTGPIFSVAFSPDGQRIASTSWDRSIRLWDATTGQEILALRGHEAAIHNVAFSPDGHRIASASDDLTVKLWDATASRASFMLNADWRYKDYRTRDEPFLREIALRQLETNARDEVSRWNQAAAGVRSEIKYELDRVDMKDYMFRGGQTMTTGKGKQSFEASGDCIGHVYLKAETR
jgi:WD40 repeat protein